MDKKEEIIECIKNSKRLATGRVAGIIGIDFGYAQKYLMELEHEKKVKRIEETNATYWELIE